MEKYKEILNHTSKNHHLNLRAELEKWWLHKQAPGYGLADNGTSQRASSKERGKQP